MISLPPEHEQEVIQAACELYASGLHCFPLPPGSKKPYGPTGFLRAARLHRGSLPDLFRQSNIGVMAGRLSGHLLVLDCDTPQEFARVDRILTERGIQPWVRCSSRGGQFWMTCLEGDVANAKIGAL